MPRKQCSINYTLVIISFAFLVTISLLVVIVSCDERRFHHSKQEIELTKQVKISQKRCKQNETPIFVHSAAKSSGKYFNRRQTTRRSWAKDALKNNMRVFFVLGLPDSNRTQKLLEKEANKYKDILQFGFRDDYYNLTLKAISILGWAANNCLTGDYIVKTDDDVILNAKLLKEMLEKKSFGNGMTGRLLYTNANRRVGHKWHMPEELYPRDYYQFILGFSHILSKNAVKPMYDTVNNYTGPVLDIDDLFMSGVIAERARVRKYDSPLFGAYCSYEPCYLNSMLVVHGCDTPDQTRQLYNAWQNTTRRSCRNRFFGFNVNNRDFGFTEIFNSFNNGLQSLRRRMRNNFNAFSSNDNNVELSIEIADHHSNS